MTQKHELLTEFVARYPAQPATAFWREIEIERLARAFASTGLGLDLGCGDGILTDILFKRIGITPNLVGIDIDPLETEAAGSYAFYDRIHTCAAQAIPEPGATFDYVISNSVLEHIPDLEGVIAEMSRVLKPGGTFYFTIPAPGFHRNLRGSVVPGMSRDRYLEALDKRLAHYHYLSVMDWHEMAKAHGLVIDSAEGYLDRGETQRWETLSRMTGGLLHTLSPGRSRPIEIQRVLKIRALQNKFPLPRPLASAVARIITKDATSAADSGDMSCLLVIGHRPD